MKGMNEQMNGIKKTVTQETKDESTEAQREMERVKDELHGGERGANMGGGGGEGQ